MMPAPEIKKITSKIDQLEYTPQWAGYALANTTFNFDENPNQLQLIVQRQGEHTGKYNYNYKLFLTTSKKEPIDLHKQIFPDALFKYAALVITRVISIVDENTITTDLGHKSVAAENPLPRIHFLNAPGAIPVSQSEEHLVVNVDNAALYHPGTVLYGVPVHTCPTVALYETAMVVEADTAVDEWKVIAGNRKITM